jgi:hypothetical protein
LRGLIGGFEPARLPPLPVTWAWRTGARRRASRQMKNEIPESTMTAPSAIAIALELLSPPLLVDELVVGVTSGVLVVGTDPVGTGNPGASGFEGPCASAAPERASAATSVAARTSAASRDRTAPGYASGCSIAGVSGAET